MNGPRDSVDEIIEQWGRAWPELDVSAEPVLSRIARIDLHLDRLSAATLASQRLSTYAYRLLRTVRRAGPPFRLTPGELSRILLVSTGAMTNQIDQLEAAGLVVRRPDPSDRRVVLVELTAEGRERIDAAILALGRSDERVLAPLTASERATAAKILRKVLVALEAGRD